MNKILCYKFQEPLGSDDVLNLIELFKNNPSIFERVNNEIKLCSQCKTIGHSGPLYSVNQVVHFEKKRNTCKECRRLYKQKSYLEKKNASTPKK